MGFYNKKIVKKPRKIYGCGLCDKKIDGEHYYIAAVQDGDFTCWRVHIKCHCFAAELCESCCENPYCEKGVDECFKEFNICNLENRLGLDIVRSDYEYKKDG